MAGFELSMNEYVVGAVAGIMMEYLRGRFMNRNRFADHEDNQKAHNEIFRRLKDVEADTIGTKATVEAIRERVVSIDGKLDRLVERGSSK